MKRLRPSRANFVDAYRWNAVLKRRTKRAGFRLEKISILRVLRKKIGPITDF